MTAILPAGSNHTRLWGLTPRERLARIAAKQDLDFASGPGGGPLVANLDFVFDPAWVRWIAGRPNHLVTQSGVPVLAHVVDLETRLAVTLAMAEGRPASAGGLTVIAFEESGRVASHELGTCGRPFMGRLTPDTVRSLERESFVGACKGVTDLLARYVWPELALVLTRISVRARMTPNRVTALGGLLCAAAAVLFAYGWFWTGLFAGFAFSLLDTVDGVVARCTVSASAVGRVLDRGIGLVHPPFWWWAWGLGLHVYGSPVEPELFRWVFAAIVGGHVAQRAVEGRFAALFEIPMELWRRFDSGFRLVSAGRNPNMLILLACLAAGRPDWGLLAVAGWTIASLLVQMVRFGQAMALRSPVRSWLA